jgi:phosphohistidine phosphatase
MKELILVRHAKSSWEFGDLDDFDRPLNDRGLRDAPRVAARVAGTCPAPDVLATSPATRAFQTALFFRHAWDLPWEKFELWPGIYEASSGDLLGLATRLCSRGDRVALFGHNPGMSLFLDLLTGDGREMKTACVARVSFEGAPEPGQGSLDGYHSP